MANLVGDNLNKYKQNDSTNIVQQIPISLPFYPNPSMGIFEVPTMYFGQPYALKNQKGKLVLKGTLEQQIDLSPFAAGTYFLSVGPQQFKLLKN